ncbi:MAG: HAMP domain-containing protein [candidate division WOR-3 bacterium]
MSRHADQMATTDVELLRAGYAVTFHFQEAHRAGLNYVVYQDSSYLRAVQTYIEGSRTAARRARELDTLLTAYCDSLLIRLTLYQELVDSLTAIHSVEILSLPPRQELKELRIRQQLLLEQATHNPAIRDSLLNQASSLTLELETAELVGMTGSPFLERIHTVGSAITEMARRIAARANQRLSEHQTHIRRLSTWSQRNILTALLVLVGLLGWLVIRLPRTIILPVKRIANALTRAETGSLDIHITPTSRDEIGQLSLQLNRVFARLREINELRRDHILHLERRFRTLASDINEGVLVVDRSMTIIYANPALKPLLDVDPAVASGRSLTDFPRLTPLKPAIEQTLSGTSGHQECAVLPEFARSAICIETLRGREGLVTAALVVITNPTPEPIDTDSVQPS